MFSHYQRSCTSFVCAMATSQETMRDIQRLKKSRVNANDFSRHLEENEFVLLKTFEHEAGMDSEEVTLFVTSIHEGFVYFDVVQGNPDEFWKKELEGEHHDAR